MMRILMVLALAVLTVMAIAQDEAKETKRYEVAVDTEELVAGVEGLADLLEKKLSGPAKDYYDVLVAKNKLYGKVGVGGGALLLLVGIVLVWVACRYGEADSEFVATGFGVLGGVACIVGFMLIGVNAGLLIAPEYHAMQEFLRTASSFMP